MNIYIFFLVLTREANVKGIRNESLIFRGEEGRRPGRRGRPSLPRPRLHWPGRGWKDSQFVMSVSLERQSVCHVGQSKYNYMCLEFDGKFEMGRKGSFSS